MKYLITLVILFCSTAMVAQEYFYLEEIKLKKKSDFVENEKEVIKAIDYMLTTSVDDNNPDRFACGRFILRYAEKSPNVTITMDETVLKLSRDNRDLLVMYMGLWIKAAIKKKGKENSYYENYVYTELSKYCGGDNGIVQTELINSLIEAGENGSIDQWVADFKVSK